MNKTELDEYIKQINTIRSKIRFTTDFEEKSNKLPRYNNGKK